MVNEMADTEMRFSFRKIAESISMSFDIPDSEKELAEEALLRFEEAGKSLTKAIDHLEIIYAPFEKHDSIATESIIEHRGILNRFQQASKKNFEKFKYLCVLAIQKLNNFSSGDTEVQEIINTFESSVMDVEGKVEEFLANLEDYEDKDFQNKVLSTVDSIKVEADKLNDLIYERIIEHINTNLIGKTWMSDMESSYEDLQQEDRIPLVMELFKERQEMLSGSAPSPEKDVQSLNPSDAPRVLSPDNARTVNFTEFEDKK